MAFKLEIKKYLQLPLQGPLSINIKSNFIYPFVSDNLNIHFENVYFSIFSADPYAEGQSSDNTPAARPKKLKFHFLTSTLLSKTVDTSHFRYFQLSFSEGNGNIPREPKFTS